MRFLSKASMMMVVERRMDQPAALGWRARDVKRLWSGCGLWDGFVVVVAAAVASTWMGLGVACIEVWINGVCLLVWGAREDAVFLTFLSTSYLPLPYFVPHGSLLIFNRQSSHWECN